MARRKKEPRSVHRDNIASVASELFAERGISATSMDDIAKAAGYSKATLYVYFENKEEIVSILVLDSMKKMCSYISSALQLQTSTRAKYDLICKELTRYQDEYPFYFKMMLDKINVNFENQDFFPEEKESYEIGEEINKMIKPHIAAYTPASGLQTPIRIFSVCSAYPLPLTAEPLALVPLPGQSVRESPPHFSPSFHTALLRIV